MAAKNIEVGQKWVTRNGRKVKVSRFDEGAEYPFTVVIDGDIAEYLVDQYGCELAPRSPSPLDLVRLVEPAPAQPEDDFNPLAAPEQPSLSPLQAGQKWRTRCGDIVRLKTNEDPYSISDFPFFYLSCNGIHVVIRATGMHNLRPTDWDLVELLESAPAQPEDVQPEAVQPEPAKPGLEVGQVWLARNGREVRIIAKLDSAASKDHPWACEDSKGISYTVNDNGFEFTSEMQTAHDLIERVAHPPLEAYKFSAFKPDRYIRDDALAVFEFAAEPAVPVELAQAPADPVLLDAEALAVETLNGLGFRFDGQCWVQDAVADSPAGHPLHAVFMKAIEQAMFGKGKRHGGAATPFLDQPWRHYAKMHGRGFLTGQAAKKLEEAASTRSGEAFETEVLGALVYIGMAVLFERGEA